MKFYFYRGRTFNNKWFIVRGINNEGQKYIKLITPNAVMGFTYGRKNTLAV